MTDNSRISIDLHGMNHALAALLIKRSLDACRDEEHLLLQGVDELITEAVHELQSRGMLRIVSEATDVKGEMLITGS